MKPKTTKDLIRFLRKTLPSPVKHKLRTAACSLLSQLTEDPDLSKLIRFQSPDHNPWWRDLVERSSGKIFVTAGSEAKTACEDIRKRYHPVLDQYGVDGEEFFMGSIKDADAEALYALVRERKPALVYQVGTFVGYSAMVIAHALRENGKGRLVAVDPELPHRTFINPVDVARKASQTLGLEERVEFVKGCHSISLSDFVGHKMGSKVPVTGRSTLEALGSEVDLVFIDGDHSVSATISDFMTVKDYLRLGGVVVFHDVYSWPSVANALSIMLGDNYYYVRGTEAYFSLDTSPGWDGLAALEHIDRSRIPVMQIRVVSRDNGTPLVNALVRLPLSGFKARTDNNGCAYLYCELSADTPIEIIHRGYPPHAQALGASTCGDYVEIEVRLNHEDSATSDCSHRIFGNSAPLIRTFGREELQEITPQEKEQKLCSDVEVQVCRPIFNDDPVCFRHACRTAGLSRIDLLMGTYKRINPGILSLRIMKYAEKKETAVREVSVDAGTLKDNRFASFNFRAIEDSEDETYYFFLTLNDGIGDLCPGLWYGKKSSPS